MKTIKQQLTKISPLTVGLGLLSSAVISYVIAISMAASGTATMYASPGGTQSVGLNGSFTVNVRISSAANVPVSGSSTYMTYPADKLQVQSINYTGSSYSLQLIENNTAGTLRMDRGALPVVTGDKLFAAVTFKAIKAGSAAIGFSNSSVVTSGEDDSNILAAKNGVTYNISAPVVPTPSTPTPSTPGASTPPATSAPNTSRPSSGTAQVSPRSPGSTTGSAPPQVAQGGDPAAPSAPVDSSQPSSSETGEGIQTSAAGVVQNIEIVILDKNKKPVKGAEVTLLGQKAITDENGIARFVNVPAGNVSVAVNYKGKKTNREVAVKGVSTSATPESYNLQIDDNKINPIVVLLPPIVGMLLVAGALFGRPWLKQRINSHNSNKIVAETAPAPSPDIYFGSPQPGSSFSPQQQPDSPKAKENKLP